MEGTAISPGPSEAQDSHGAECTGILGGLRLLLAKTQEWNQPVGKITVACDNISALNILSIQNATSIFMQVPRISTYYSQFKTRYHHQFSTSTNM